MKMRLSITGLLILAVSVSAACLATFPPGGGTDTDPVERWDQSGRLVDLAAELERRAVDVARSASDQFIDRGGSLMDDQIAVLFASEGFASSSRLFLRMTERGSGYTARVSSRSGLDRAFQYLNRDFINLEEASRRAGIQLYALSECASLLRRLNIEIGGSGNVDNFDRDRRDREQEEWDGKYVKGRDSAVFLLERRGTGDYLRRPFKNLESLFKYNYDQDRGKNPWGFVAEVPSNLLDRMRTGTMIERTFEGLMIIEPENRPNRPVYLIRGGKRHGLSRPELVARYGGWSKVYEVPREVIDDYPEGDPIK